MEKQEYCLRCLSIGLKKKVYAKSEGYLEAENPFEELLANLFCADCTQNLSIPLERPEYIQKKLTKDLLRLSMNIDNIKSQIAQLIYNLSETYKEAQQYRDSIKEVEKYKKSPLPPSIEKLKEECEKSRLNLWDGPLKDFKDSKLTIQSLGVDHQENQKRSQENPLDFLF
ncbi:MAG: hypothetical protein CME68_10870 [Halobacteriovoraceae bacterium]|nr:hypothetical protein [Halobacteriovoraceae bacterium]